VISRYSRRTQKLAAYDTLKERMAALRAETNDSYQYKPSGIPLHWDLGTQSESGLKRSN
jgi:hypothetical protein